LALVSPLVRVGQAFLRAAAKWRQDGVENRKYKYLRTQSRKTTLLMGENSENLIQINGQVGN